MIENRPKRNTGTFTNVYHPPEDAVKVYVLVGKDLVKEGTSSDLACELVYDGNKYSTKYVKDDAAPFWDEGLRVLSHQMKGELKIQVWDKVGNKATGWAILKLEEIPPMFDDWVRLQNEQGEYAGEVRLTIANEIGLQ